MGLELLFITRNYPPKVGGLETYSYNLIREFEGHNITHKIVLSKSIIHLVWFLPYSFFVGIYIGWKNSIRSIHLCDGLLGPVGIVLKLLTRAKISITIHGLDVTYGNPLFQLIVPWCIARLDKVICVSRSTRDECIRRGIPGNKCTVIPNGIRPSEFYLPISRDNLRHRLEKIVGASLQDKIVLVTIGRLVERKGITWFVDNVMPHLDKSYCYLIVGDGPEREHIQQVLRHHGLHDRVLMLGKVADEERNVILNESDILVMPNITVPDDVEGFGIVIIEAGSCGLPAIASNIQGIRDAVLDGKTGYLVEERDVNGFLTKINNMNLTKESVRSIVNNAFDWAQIYERYSRVFIEMGSGEK